MEMILRVLGVEPGDEVITSAYTYTATASVIKSGYYIRKFKLDELPQLINVFLGDMSLVGSRPEVRHYVNYWSPEQMRVLDVRPGIMDPASIKFRNENELTEQAKVSPRLRMNYDLRNGANIMLLTCFWDFFLFYFFCL